MSNGKVQNWSMETSSVGVHLVHLCLWVFIAQRSWVYMQCTIGPNTPEQAAMSSHTVLHTAWQDLAIGIEEVTDYGPVFFLCSSMTIVVLKVSRWWGVDCTLLWSVHYIFHSSLLEEEYTYGITGEMYLGIVSCKYLPSLRIHVHSLNVLCRKAIVISSRLILELMYWKQNDHLSIASLEPKHCCDDSLNTSDHWLVPALCYRVPHSLWLCSYLPLQW